MADSANVAGPVLNKAHFRVELTGFPVGYWSKAKIPRPKTKPTTVHPAGAIAPLKFPSGVFEVGEVELTGYQDTGGQMEAAVKAWFEQVGAVWRTGQATVPPEQAKRDLTIVQCDTDGREVAEWRIRGAFPLEQSDLDLEAGKEDPTDRQLKLSADWIDQVK